MDVLLKVLVLEPTLHLKDVRGDLELRALAPLLTVGWRSISLASGVPPVRTGSKLLHSGDCQSRHLIDRFLDCSYHQLVQLTALTPALIAKLHLEPELGKNTHKFTVHLPVDLPPYHMEKGGQVDVISDHKVER